MSKYKTLITLLLTAGMLSSCNNYYFFHHRNAARLPSRQQLCTQLRQQVIFQKNAAGPAGPNPNPNETQAMPTQQAKAINEYQRYNCEELE
jgi:hypothetical protein